jgi:hypothetical protein
LVIETNPPRRRRLLREWWTEIVTVRPHHGAHWPALRVGIAVTVPLAALLLAGRPEWTPYAVFGSLGAVYGKHHDYPARLRAQTGVSLALMIAIILGTVVGILTPGSLWAVAMMTAMSVLGYLLSQTLGWLPVPALFLVFAMGTISSYQHTWSDLPIAVIVSALAALLAIAVGQLGRLLPKSPRDKLPATPRVPLRALWATPRLWVELAAYGLGPLLAGSAATLIGIGHPYWAAVSATVPLSGATLASRIGRASLRLGGTVVGIGIAFAILNATPAAWILVLAVAALDRHRAVRRPELWHRRRRDHSTGPDHRLSRLADAARTTAHRPRRRDLARSQRRSRRAAACPRSPYSHLTWSLLTPSTTPG